MFKIKEYFITKCPLPRYAIKNFKIVDETFFGHFFQFLYYLPKLKFMHDKKAERYENCDSIVKPAVVRNPLRGLLRKNILYHDKTLFSYRLSYLECGLCSKTFGKKTPPPATIPT